MTFITVSDEQARLISEASFPIVLVDVRGCELGQVAPSRNLAPQANMNDDDWAEAMRQREIARREGGPFFTTKEVLEHLKSLESG